MNREINNFDTWKILKNSFKKIKNSGPKTTINYLLFKILSSKNINENTQSKAKVFD